MGFGIKVGTLNINNLMLIVASILLAIVAAVNSKAIAWTQQLPKDYILINKDQLSLPIDEYVNLSSAIFTANDPTKNRIIPKIEALMTAPSSQASNMQSCSLASNSRDTFSIYVCNQRMIRIEKDGNFLTNKDTTKNIELVTNGSLPQIPALDAKSTLCTDMFLDNGFYYVNCYDKSTVNNPSYIFKVGETLNTSFTVGTCDTGAIKGDSKMVRLLTSVAGKTPLLFFDVSKVTSDTAGNITVVYCNLDATQAVSKSPSTAYNLFSIINNQTLSKGVLRHITSISTTELLAFIAVDDGTTKALFTVPLSINEVGEIKSHPTFNITQWNGSKIDSFNPRFMSVYGTSDFFVASDKANLYTLKFAQNYTLMTNETTVIPPGMILPWNVPLDCGVVANPSIYISRIDMVGGNLDINNPASRLLIVYSSIDDKKVKEFAVHINNTKYGCSRATTSADPSIMSTVNTVSFGIDSSIFTTADERITKARINYNTMLSINLTSETADKSVDISVKMEGWDSPTSQQFIYKSLKNAQDFNNITVGAKTFKVYANTSTYLAVPSFNFKGNNPVFESTNANVKVLYSSSPKVSLTGLNLTDYTINRTFAVDEDTFVAVVRKAGSPEGFIRIWNKFNGISNVVDVTNSTIIPLMDRQIVFKIFKIGNYFCVILKANGGSAKKLTINCYEDKKEAPVRPEANGKVITDDYEISDIQILEADTRVDMLMIGTTSSFKDNSVLHFYVSINSDNQIVIPDSSYVKKIDTSAKPLTDYYPTDITFDVWGDSEGTSYVTVKLVSKFNLPPAVAKFNMSGTSTGTPPTLAYLYHMYIPSVDVAFCSIKNEMIFFSQKKKQILVKKMMRTPTGVILPQNNLYLPIEDYGIVYFLQFNCIPEKSIFQVLGVGANKQKFLISFRGGETTNGARRVHSVVRVADTATFIESAFNQDFIVTVVNSPGGIDAVRDFVYTYPDGPKFIVDNTNLKDSYDVSISSTSGSTATSKTTVRVELVVPKLKAELKPKSTFEIKPDQTIFLDQVSNIEGPVMDIKVEGADASKVKIVKRNNKQKGYTGGNSTTTPDRVFADEDFMVLMYSGSYFKILGDPSITKSGAATSPPEVLTKTVNIKEAALLKYGTQDKTAILVTRTYEGDQFRYNIYFLQRTQGLNSVYEYKYVESENLYQTNIDYDSLQVVTIGNGDVVIALKMKRSFNSNYIRLLSFQRLNTGKFTFRSTTILVVDSTKEIGGHSLSWDGSNQVSVIAFYKDFDYLVIGRWDGINTQSSFRPSATKYKMNDTDLQSIQIQYIRCWPGNVTGKIECIVDALGVVDYLIEITPEQSQNGTLDPLTSIVKTADFEMPPLFEIKRTDKGKDHYGFLLQKSVINNAVNPSVKRILQQSMALDSFSECDNILVFFKPSVGRYIYTGITCSEWGKNGKVDFAMEYETNDNIYITKWPVEIPTPPTPPTPAKRILQTSTTDRVGANYLSQIQVTVSGQVDPSQVKFSFIGLGGPNDLSSNPAVTLADFQKGALPNNNSTTSGSSFWTWFIIILVVLLIVGGGIYGYMWYQNSQTSETSSTYTKQHNRDSSKNDLEDTRL